jgi:hypothetical protein
MDSNKFQTFLGIMAFYIILSYILFPLAFYYLIEANLTSAGNGYVAGSLFSVILWLAFGRKMV